MKKIKIIICFQIIQTAHLSFKVLQAEFIGFAEQVRAVHATRVQNDIRALRYLVPFYDVIRQSSAHGEVHHGLKSQALIDEGLQNLQLWKISVPQVSLTCRGLFTQKTVF